VVLVTELLPTHAALPNSTVLSLNIDVALFGTPFMEKFFGGYLSTSNKISELNIYEKLPTSRRSMNRDDGRITGSKAVTLFAALETNQSLVHLSLVTLNYYLQLLKLVQH